jgi:hypothetical protein
MPSVAHRSSAGAATLAVLGTFVFASVYFTGLFRPFFNPNELSRFQTVYAFVELGTFAIDEPLRRLGNHEDKASSGGRFYSNKAPGLALAGIPIYRILRVFLPPPPASGDLPFLLLRLLTVSLVSVIALARFARRIARDRSFAGVAAIVTFAVAFGTPRLLYTRTFFGHAWTAALLFLAWDLLRDDDDRRRGRLGGLRRGRIVLAGLLAGWALISEYTVAPVVLFLTIRAVSGRRWNSLLPLAAGAAIPAALILVYQAVSFGSPFVVSSAREAFPEYAELARRGIFGLGLPRAGIALDYLFHPARGVLLFSPFLLWAAPGFVRWWRSGRERADCFFALASTVSSFLLLSGYPNWHGGWALGSRYLLPLVFLVAAAIPFALGSALSRGLFVAVAVFSAAVHVLATFSFPHFPLDLTFPPVNGAWWFLRHGWVAGSLGDWLGLPGVVSVLLVTGLAAVAAILAAAAARPLSPGAPAAILLGIAPLLLALWRPPALSYSARLTRAVIFANYSGRDPAREELAKVVAQASTPIERRQAAIAWKTSGPR